jgi:hypothetical protein
MGLRFNPRAQNLTSGDRFGTLALLHWRQPAVVTGRRYANTIAHTLQLGLKPYYWRSTIDLARYAVLSR